MKDANCDATFGSAIEAGQFSYGFNDDDFLSDEAAKKLLDDDEAEFEYSNRYRIPDNDITQVDRKFEKNINQICVLYIFLDIKF